MSRTVSDAVVEGTRVLDSTPRALQPPQRATAMRTSEMHLPSIQAPTKRAFTCSVHVLGFVVECPAPPPPAAIP